MPVIAEDNIILKVLADTKQAQKSVDRLDDSVDDLDDSTNKVGDSFSKLGKLVGVALAAGVVVKFAQGVAKIASNAADAYAEFEKTEKVFAQLVGDVGEANKLLKELTDFSIKSALDPGVVNSAAKSLLGYGRSTKQVLSDVKALGAISAATGADIQRLAEIYGEASIVGRVEEEQLIQLAEQGIPLFELLAKSMGKSVSEVKALQRAGNLTFADLEKGFEDATTAGGKFGDALVARVNTIDGMRTVIRNTFQDISRVIGEKFAPVIRGVLKVINEVANGLRDFVIGVDNDFVLRLAAALEAASLTLGSFSEEFKAWVKLNAGQAESIGLFFKRFWYGLKSFVTQNPLDKDILDQTSKAFTEARKQNKINQEELTRLQNVTRSSYTSNYNRILNDLKNQAKNKIPTQPVLETVVLGPPGTAQKIEAKAEITLTGLFNAVDKIVAKVQAQRGATSVPLLESIFGGVSGSGVDISKFESEITGKDERGLLARMFDLDEQGLAKFNESGRILLQSAKELTNSLVQEEIRRNDMLLAIQDKRIQDILGIASEGNAEQLQLEEQRRDDLLQQRQKFLERERILNAVEITANNAVIVSNMLVGIAKQFSKNTVVGIITALGAAGVIAATIASIKGALSTSIPAFAGGTEYFDGEAGTDNNLAWLSKGERVVDSKTNSILNGWGVRNEQLAPLIGMALGKYSAPVIGQGYSKNEIGELKQGLREVKQAIYAIQFNVNIDEDGIGVMAGNYLSEKNRVKSLMA